MTIMTVNGFDRQMPLQLPDRDLLLRLITPRTRLARAKTDIVREGEVPSDIHVLLEGWACRYKTFGDGRRQIVGFLLPGDMCELNILSDREMDNSIGALTPVRVARLSRKMLADLASSNHAIARALWWDSLVGASILREWTVNLGRRTAFQRLGHLFCELYMRLEAIGQVQGKECDLPLTQVDIADATGLTPVHVNRTLQQLRAADLIILNRHELRIPDLAELKRASLFDAGYLHLDGQGRRHNAFTPST